MISLIRISVQTDWVGRKVIGVLAERVDGRRTVRIHGLHRGCSDASATRLIQWAWNLRETQCYRPIKVEMVVR